MAKETASYAAALVREHDRDRFALALTAPRDRREALCALFAFNYEIARTREVVTQPQLGLIRLQWWRDALEAFYGEGHVPAHETMAALAAAIRGHNLPPLPFEELLTAREFDLGSRPPATLEEMEAYAADVTAPLNRLVLAVLDQKEDEAAVQAVSAAWGLTGLLRAVPFHAGQGRCYLPAALTEAESLSASSLHRPDKHAALAGVAKIIGMRAAELLKAANAGTPFMRATAALTGANLKRLDKRGYDLFSPGLEGIPPGFSMRALFGFF